MPGATLLYGGIDEAGYGPMLGPLCAALTLFEAPIPAPGSNGLKPPNLWSILKGAVCKEPRAARSGRIAVNDSKRLKLANDWTNEPWVVATEPASRHPLLHLERGVLAFVGAWDSALGPGDAAPLSPLTDDRLFARLGVGLEPHPWYAGEPLVLPLSGGGEALRLRANALCASLAAAGVRVRAIRARAVGEDAFNGGCERFGSKGAVNFHAAASLLREAWDSAEPGADDPPDRVEGGPRIVLDRHGGRTAYAEPLAGAFPDATVEILEERDDVSRYRLRGRDDARREMTIIFQVRADSAHFPVALASMTAKLVRELAMARFNRHFCSRAPSLTPTAGYLTDARRWLRDAAPALSDHERRALVRRQ